MPPTAHGAAAPPRRPLLPYLPSLSPSPSPNTTLYIQLPDGACKAQEVDVGRCPAPVVELPQVVGRLVVAANCRQKQQAGAAVTGRGSSSRQGQAQQGARREGGAFSAPSTLPVGICSCMWVAAGKGHAGILPPHAGERQRRHCCNGTSGRHANTPHANRSSFLPPIHNPDRPSLYPHPCVRCIQHAKGGCTTVPMQGSHVLACRNGHCMGTDCVGAAPAGSLKMVGKGAFFSPE